MNKYKGVEFFVIKIVGNIRKKVNGVFLTKLVS